MSGKRVPRSTPFLSIAGVLGAPGKNLLTFILPPDRLELVVEGELVFHADFPAPTGPRDYHQRVKRGDSYELL